MTELQSTILCPMCGYAATETMPTNACVLVYECARCGTCLAPRKGDCCVFCSYGSVPCPPMQNTKLSLLRGTKLRPLLAPSRLSPWAHRHRHHCPIGPKSRALHARPSMHNLIRYS